ncbi:MAG: methionyl-tRNA formyltransferase [Spirochaetaceae bacterium]|jgi:methionyl-tRNA formyltransferase|nr:methionyl-tRNA formyltransferase [Spirochaetaceae bacterium]
MRILFAGTPEIAVPSLKALARIHAENDFCELAGVLTNPDTAKGRRGGSTPSGIGAAANEILRDIAARGKKTFTVLKNQNIDEACFRSAAELGAELLVSFAYGALFPAEFLALFPMGGVNIHPSLLPKYRGASPVSAAILNQERETGISIQRIAAELDSGNILAQEVIALTGKETSASLSAVVAEKSAAILVRTLHALAAGGVVETAQNHADATFCGKLEREDGRIDWRKSARVIDACIRAYTPWPLSYTRHKGGELYILEAAPYNGECTFTAENPNPAGAVIGVDKGAGIIIQTGDGLLAVSRLQYHARKPLDWRSFLNGAQNFTGSVLG